MLAGISPSSVASLVGETGSAGVFEIRQTLRLADPLALTMFEAAVDFLEFTLVLTAAEVFVRFKFCSVASLDTAEARLRFEGHILDIGVALVRRIISELPLFATSSFFSLVSRVRSEIRGGCKSGLSTAIVVF